MVDGFPLAPSVVLLIDDQRIVAEAIRRELMGETDIIFHACHDPVVAVEEALRVEPTVILLDMVMPVVDGLMLLKIFRLHPELKSLPVVMLSSNDDPETKANAFLHGAHDYLVKIPHKVEMIARIRYHSQAYRMNLELRRSNAALAELSRQKGEFLAMMSHEIRTPLNGILGVAELLSQDELSASQSHYVEVMRKSGTALLGLINDVLDFSKIEAGKLELENGAFDLDQLLDEVLQLNARAAQDKGLTLAGQIAPELPLQLQGDALRLRQMLSNFIGNALKFTARGHVLVSLEAERRQQDDLLLRAEVQDTGIGIGSDAQSRLFQQFSQVDAATTRKYGGTGLGLTITKQLAELMGGQVGLSSRPGEGSTFWFTARLGLQKIQKPRPHFHGRVQLVGFGELQHRILVRLLGSWGLEIGGDGPFSLILLDESRLDQLDDFGSTPVCLLQSLGPSRVQPPHRVLFKPPGVSQLLAVLRDFCSRAPVAVRPSLHLLLAEDDLTSQLVTEAVLKKLGHTVDIVDNGVEAVKAASERAYDAILMDCSMPELSGFDAARQIRAQPHERRIPIIAMTAFWRKEEHARALESGMDQVLTKPMSFQALQEALERWISCR